MPGRHGARWGLVLALGLGSLVAAGRVGATAASDADLAIADATVTTWGWPNELRTQVGLAWLEVSVVNRGPSTVDDAELVITLPPGIGVDTSNAGFGPIGASCGRGDGNVVRCEVTAPGAPAVLGQPFGVQLLLVNEVRPAGETSTIGIDLRSDAPDPVLADNRADVPVTFAGGPMPTEPGTADLTVVPGPAPMSVTVMNRGPESTRDVELTISTPDGVRIVGVDVGWGQPCVIDSSNVARCQLLGFSGTFTWTTIGIRLSTQGGVVGTPVTVSVVIGGGVTDPDPTNDRAELTMVVAGGGTEPPTTAPTQPSGALPATGGSPVGLVLAAVAMLVLGALARRSAQVADASKMLPMDSSS